MSASRILLIMLAAVAGMVLLAGGCVLSGLQPGHHPGRGGEEPVGAGGEPASAALRADSQPDRDRQGRGQAGREDLPGRRQRPAKPISRPARSTRRLRPPPASSARCPALLVLREQYPQLKSNQSFLKLQDQLEGTENRLAVERKRFNDGVTAVNTFIRKLPGRFLRGPRGDREGRVLPGGGRGESDAEGQFLNRYAIRSIPRILSLILPGSLKKGP